MVVRILGATFTEFYFMKSEKTKTKKKPIPKFKSEDEEREFWATHDSADYIDWKKAKRTKFPNLKPTKKPKQVKAWGVVLKETHNFMMGYDECSSLRYHIYHEKESALGHCSAFEKVVPVLITIIDE